MYLIILEVRYVSGACKVLTRYVGQEDGVASKRWKSETGVGETERQQRQDSRGEGISVRVTNEDRTAGCCCMSAK